MPERNLSSMQPRRQRGAIAIIVGLSMLVVIGAGGLALDSGRLYISKTETQNAADACALAASLDLTGFPAIQPTQFPIAEDAGRAVASLNRTNFNNTLILPGAVTVQFGTSLAAGSTWVSAASATADSKYVRCSIDESGIAPALMQVLGFGPQIVNSRATASLEPSQNSCTALPVSLCATSNTPPYGLTPGQWLTGTFGTRGQLTGSFGWIDFSPPSGGASELSALLLGAGACTVAVGAPVGQTGAINSLRARWNTRFGIYSGGPSNDAGVPDRSGYGYTPFNWPSQANALSDFLSVRRPANAPYGTSIANGNTITGLDVGPNNSGLLNSSQLATRGSSRRIAPVPIVRCNEFAGSQ